MFGALRDCVVPMTKVRHLSSHQVLLDAFDREISNHLKDVSMICPIPSFLKYNLFQFELIAHKRVHYLLLLFFSWV